MSITQNKILMEIEPRLITLGDANGPTVHRLIPYAKKRMIGPFIFFDYLPVNNFAAGAGIDVRPHPHIGLSTLSYLLEGHILHHDSLGNKQLLSPGDVNWMTAGSGISHSERMPPDMQTHPHRLSLLQFWIALPLAHEDDSPSFTHHEKREIPEFLIGDAKVSLIAGKAFGHSSPVAVYSELFFMKVELSPGQLFEFDPGDQELAFFITSGRLSIGEHSIAADDFVVMELGSSLKAIAAEMTTFIVLGGKSFPEPRHIFWNYVSSSKEKIKMANEKWISGVFPQVPGESDVILPPPTNL